MTLVASGAFTERRDSGQAGREVGQRLLAAADGPLGVVLVYLTVNHDPGLFLAALQATVGPGVAIVGSLFASVYSGRLDDLLGGSVLPAEALAVAKESVGAGAEVARVTAEQAGPEAGQLVQDAVNVAFLDGFHLGSWVSAGITLLGAAMALRWLPSRAAAIDSDSGGAAATSSATNLEASASAV